jgi:hypothetical protein
MQGYFELHNYIVLMTHGVFRRERLASKREKNGVSRRVSG